jgi:hypothetical protein
MQTVSIFSYPQVITKSPTFQVMIENIINSQSLRLVCIDEIDLVVHFGLPFHLKVIEVRPLLFGNSAINVRMKSAHMKKQYVQFSL